MRKYLTSFRRKLTLLVACAILLPMLITSLLLGDMLDEKLQESFASRLEASLETFSLILENRQNTLDQSLFRIASDNTIQMTLDLEILPQLKRYLDRQLEVLPLSSLVIVSTEKRVIVSAGKPLAGFTLGDVPRLFVNETDALLYQTKPIYRKNDLLGYVVGAFSLKDKNQASYLDDRLYDNFAIWIDGNLIVTDIDTIFGRGEMPLDVSGISGEQQGQSTDHYKILTQTTPFGENRLTYGVLLPLAEQEKEFASMVGVIVALVATLFGMIMWLLRYFIKELIAPVTQLTTAASRIEQGKEIPELDTERRDEFGRMADAFQRMVTNLRGSERELKTHRDSLAERTVELEETQNALVMKVRSLNCLYSVSALVHSPGLSIKDVVRECANLLPGSWQYPRITGVRLRVEGEQIETENFRETDWMQSSEIRANGSHIGSVEIAYLEAMPEKDEGPFLKEERNLINAISKEIGRFVEYQQFQAQIQKQAFYDQLTQLPNRALFMEHLKRAARRRCRNSSCSYAVLFLDLDRFKVINDSLGHIVGDQLLMAVAQRLTTLVRPEDIVSRFGGDEFVMLLDAVKNVRDATRVAERIQQVLATPFAVDEQSIFTTASIGIALSSDGYEKEEYILRDADSAMYSAKSRGRGRCEVFDVAMHASAMKLLQLEADLRYACKRKDFQVHYQPIVSLATQKIVAAEALVRWNHPQRGAIPPAEFIPLAEDTGLIGTIGEIVLDQACAQNRQWHADGFTGLRMSVNFSAKQFLDKRLIDKVTGVLRSTGLDGRYLDVEITETVAMEAHSIFVLQELSKAGVRTSIDDFGTGYSSLGSLKSFPIDSIKIDMSFIREIAIDSNADAIVMAIIAMAHKLGMAVIAEGVERKDQLDFLKENHCDEIQGYLISPPVRTSEFRTLLEAERSREVPVPMMESGKRQSRAAG